MHINPTFSLCFLLLFIGSIATAQETWSLHELDSLYYHYKDEGDYEQSLYYAELNLKRCQEKSTIQDKDYLDALQNVGGGYFQVHDYETSEAYLLEALNLAYRLFGKRHFKIASILADLANTQEGLDEYDKAQASLEESVAIYANFLPEKEMGYAHALFGLAMLHDILGEYEEAEPKYLEALKLYKKLFGEEHQEYLNAYMNLAIFYDLSEDVKRAEEIYLRAQQLFKQTNRETHPDYAILLSNMGGFYFNLGHYEQAEALLLTALDVSNQALGENAYEATGALMTLAAVYDEMGAYKKSEQYTLQSLAILKDLLGEDSYDYAISLNDLALLYDNTNRYEDAEKQYLKLVDIFTNSIGGDHPDYATVLSNMGLFYSKHQQCEKGLKYLLQARAIRAKTVAPQHSDYISVLLRIAGAYQCLGKHEQAWDYVFQAIQNNSVAELALDKNITKAWANQLLEADYYSFNGINHALENVFELLGKEKGKAEAQLIVVELALDLLELNRTHYIGDWDKQTILSSNAEWINEGMRLVCQFKTAPNWEVWKRLAFRFAEQNKSTLLAGEVQHNYAYSFGDLPDSLAGKEQDLKKSYTETKALLLEDLAEEEREDLQGYLGELSIEMKALKEQIEQKYPKYSQMKYAKTTILPSDIQAHIDDKTAFLEYVVTDSLVYLFYIDQQRFELYDFELPLDQLQKQIRGLHRSLSNYKKIVADPEKAYIDYTQRAHWFYQTLLEKALKSKTVEHLIIVTDRELGHLPFETFLVEAAPNEQNYQELHYLLKDYSISYNYSAFLWKENSQEKQRETNGQLLAFAGHYEGQPIVAPEQEQKKNAQLRGGLEPLPAAQLEVDLLSKKFEGMFLFQEEASERIFKEKAAAYDIVHLAMHGVLDRRHAILSSLVFTDTKDSVENDFLQAYEISQLKLQSNLVVLSACETGYGKFEMGNGIASLARSFMYAGVPALVVSLWQVNDASTSIIMEEFYNNLSKGMKKPEALRQAKLAYMEQMDGIAAHPAFWSPFIQVGNSQAVELNKKLDWNIWWWIGGAIVLLIGGWMGWRRKGLERS